MGRHTVQLAAGLHWDWSLGARSDQQEEQVRRVWRVGGRAGGQRAHGVVDALVAVGVDALVEERELLGRELDAVIAEHSLELLFGEHAVACAPCHNRFQ